MHLSCQHRGQPIVLDAPALAAIAQQILIAGDSMDGPVAALTLLTYDVAVQFPPCLRFEAAVIIVLQRVVLQCVHRAYEGALQAPPPKAGMPSQPGLMVLPGLASAAGVMALTRALDQRPALAKGLAAVAKLLGMLGQNYAGMAAEAVRNGERRPFCDVLGVGAHLCDFVSIESCFLKHHRGRAGHGGSPGVAFRCGRSGGRSEPR